jgi:hypothetical protein
MDGLKLGDLARDALVQTRVLAVVGALITHVRLRRYPTRRLVFQLVLPGAHLVCRRGRLRFPEQYGASSPPT